jgi:hypothetical protein
MDAPFARRSRRVIYDSEASHTVTGVRWSLGRGGSRTRQLRNAHCFSSAMASFIKSYVICADLKQCHTGGSGDLFLFGLDDSRLRVLIEAMKQGIESLAGPTFGEPPMRVTQRRLLGRA